MTVGLVRRFRLSNSCDPTGLNPQAKVEGTLKDRASACWRALRGEVPPPPSLERASQVAAREQLAMQASFQPFVDGAISKMIRLAADDPEQAVAKLFDDAYGLP